MWFSFPCLCLSEVIEMIIFKQELVTVWSQEPGFVERWAAVLGPSAALEEVSRWQTEEPSVLTCIRLKTWCIESSASLVSCGSPWFLCCQVLQLQLLEGNSDLIRTVSHHFKYMNVKIPKLCNSKRLPPRPFCMATAFQYTWGCFLRQCMQVGWPRLTLGSLQRAQCTAIGAPGPQTHAGHAWV